MAQQIRFDDPGAYESMMGTWSRSVGEVFLDWLAPPAGARWVDVGCGTGAFTRLVLERCAPAAVAGFDPAEQQVAHAQALSANSPLVSFRVGDAAAAPYADRSFDVAVMALVIFFVPDPERGVAEMMRLVRPGGIVCAYAWDMPGAGLPHASLGRLLKDAGHPALRPPSWEVSSAENLRALWTHAGLQDVEVREITVRRRFEDFEQMWEITTGAASIAAAVRELDAATREDVKRQWRAQFAPAPDGSVTGSARANAVRGRVPAG